MTGSVSDSAVFEECRQALHRLAAVAKPRAAEWIGLDLTMGQLKAVFVLISQGPVSVGGLGRALSIGEPAASLLVDRLEERELVERGEDPADRRRTLVVPTEKAKGVAVRLRRSRDEQVTGWLKRLSQDELSTLNSGLQALLQAAEVSAAAGPVRPEGE